MKKGRAIIIVRGTKAQKTQNTKHHQQQEEEEASHHTHPLSISFTHSCPHTTHTTGGDFMYHSLYNIAQMVAGLPGNSVIRFDVKHSSMTGVTKKLQR